MSDDGFDGEILLEAPVNVGAPESVGVLTVRFVRYPGSQQLIVWLPQSGYEGYAAWGVFGPGDVALEDAPVRARLNGGVQILTDTYPWAPGDYRVEITHEDGWRHELRMRKLEAGIVVAPPPPPPPEPVREEPIVYRDGFGRELPNVDLEMRAAAQKQIAARFARRLEFEGNARAGAVIYIEGETRITFYHEMCGGGVNISIDLPTSAQWEAATGTALKRRDDIVDFVARETQRIQASTWRYVIHEDRIDFID